MTAVWLFCVGHLGHALIGNGGGMTQLLSFAGYRRACVGFHGTHDFMARRHRVFFRPAFMTCRLCFYLLWLRAELHTCEQVARAPSALALGEHFVPLTVVPLPQHFILFDPFGENPSRCALCLLRFGSVE